MFPSRPGSCNNKLLPLQLQRLSLVPVGQEGYTDTHSLPCARPLPAALVKACTPHRISILTMEINMDNAMAARAQMNEVSPVKISFQDMLIKACAMALRQHPAVNSSWMGDFVRTYQHIHIGSAIALTGRTDRSGDHGSPTRKPFTDCRRCKRTLRQGPQ